MGSKKNNAGGMSFRLPDGYSRMNSMPDDPADSSAFGMQTPGCACFLMLYPVQPESAMPFEDVRPLIDGIHGSLGDDQGLIEAKCDKTLSGRPLVYSIVKTAGQPNGVQYCLTLQLDYSSLVLNVQGFFDEVGVTGTRDAAVYELAVKNGQVSVDMAGWRQDPYDPSFNRGNLMNLSEDKLYDAQFPEHPLSQLRALVDFIIQSD